MWIPGSKDTLVPDTEVRFLYKNRIVDFGRMI
jgi:hypothetical protein